MNLSIDGLDTLEPHMVLTEHMFIKAGEVMNALEEEGQWDLA